MKTEDRVIVVKEDPGFSCHIGDEGIIKGFKDNGNAWVYFTKSKDNLNYAIKSHDFGLGYWVSKSMIKVTQNKLLLTL